MSQFNKFFGCTVWNAVIFACHHHDFLVDHTIPSQYLAQLCCLQLLREQIQRHAQKTTCAYAGNVLWLHTLLWNGHIPILARCLLISLHLCASCRHRPKLFSHPSHYPLSFPCTYLLLPPTCINDQSTSIDPMSVIFSALILLFGWQKEHLAHKINLTDEVLAWIYVWSEMQTTCIWSNWCQCHLIISAKENPEQFILLILAHAGYPGKKLLNDSCVCVCHLQVSQVHNHLYLPFKSPNFFTVIQAIL